MYSLYTEYKTSIIDSIHEDVKQAIISKLCSKYSLTENPVLSDEMEALIEVIAPYLFDAQNPDFDRCPENPNRDSGG